jgi:hypothetical protein
MKKILSLVLVACFTTFSSCSIDNNSVAVEFEFIPIESVIIPAEFNFEETYTITVIYKRPTDCHSFNNLQYITELSNVRTIAVVNLYTPGDCTILDNNLQTETFTFNALDTEPYTFRFWQGKDDNGEDMYLVYEIPVVN